jgi:hypothetical protein
LDRDKSADLAGVMNGGITQSHASFARSNLKRWQKRGRVRSGLWIVDKRDACDTWNGIFEQVDPFTAHRVFVICEARNVCPGLCHASDVALPDRIGYARKNNWHSARSMLERRS